MNYVRTCKLVSRVETTEARIQARLMMIESKHESDMLSLGVPITLEDLIKRDLEDTFQEDPDNLIPPTEEELLNMMEEMNDRSKV